MARADCAGHCAAASSAPGRPSHRRAHGRRLQLERADDRRPGRTAFYGQLFGWTEGHAWAPGDYHVAKVGETSIGGIMGMPPEAAGIRAP
jgi:hypothetical protein